MTLEVVIGLEIHVQLKTKSKMFCGCSNAGEEAPPNTTVCPVCLGHPGTLPVPNETAIAWAVRTARALQCEIPHHSKFDRKHYFYPDLPKAYQISQYDEPVGKKGWMEIAVRGEPKRIRIHRLHLEEDAAKLLHGAKGESYVDYNRGGTPLMEIVTEADLQSPEEAGEFLRELRLVMRYLDVSDADMEKGHLRCDANISMRPEGDQKFYPKTEIKNLNSFKAVERALAYEIVRQTNIWEETGSAPKEQGTRGWDERNAKTVPQRQKEEANDYRYFPEPDIPELDFSPEWVARISAEIGELPRALRTRFVEEYGFSREDAKIFSSDKRLAGFAEEVIAELKIWLTSQESEHTAEEIWQQDGKKLARLVSSWILTKLLGALNAAGAHIATMKISPENFAELISMLQTRAVNAANAQIILEEMLATGKDPSDILEEKDLGQTEDDGGLDALVDAMLSEHTAQVEQYRSGKVSVLQYFVGRLMQKTNGKADAQKAVELLKKKLAS